MELFITKQPLEFQRDLIEYSLKFDSSFARSLKRTFVSLSVDKRSPLIDETSIKNLLQDSLHKITASILISNQAGCTSLPHIQWMYLNYSAKLLPESPEIIKFLAQSREEYVKKLPFVYSLSEYLECLGNKYESKIPKKLPRYNVPIVYSKALLQLLHSKQLNSFLGLSIQATRRFGSKFLHHLSNALFELGETNEALKSLMLLTYLEPLKVEQFILWGAFSIKLTSARNYWAAKLGVILFPNEIGVLLNFSGSGGSYNENREVMSRLVSIAPNSPAVLLNYANLINGEGAPEKAVELLQKAKNLEKQFSPRVESNLLFISQYASNVDYLKLKSLHVDSAARMTAGCKVFSEKLVQTSGDNRKIRVGFVSYDLINHPVSYYFYPLIKNIDPSSVEIYIYYNQRRKDSVTKLFMDIVGKNWYEIGGLSDVEAHRLIVSHSIDLLIDLSGHTAGNRLELFAMRSSINQATYLGYPFTTGLPEMDYRFADCATPDDVEYYTEKKVLVSPSYVCYQPLINRIHLQHSDLFAVSPPPCLKNGFVTFGLSTNPAKITDEVVLVFSKILTADKTYKLFIEAAGFIDIEFRDIFYKRFELHGISRERLILQPRDSNQQYLVYNNIDIALDPFPYNGGTSTLDLLWMGLPLVTLRGHVGMSSAGAHMLTHICRKEWIADTVDEYVKIALDLARDQSLLAINRNDQRSRLEKSPLMNGPAVAEGFTKVFFDIVNRVAV